MRTEIERRRCENCKKEKDFEKKVIGSYKFRDWIELKLPTSLRLELNNSNIFEEMIYSETLDFCSIRCVIEFADKIKKLYRMGEIG